MAWTIDKHGNEVDGNGYLRAAVEAWAKHGIYPPPPIGDPRRPEVVEHVKETRARIAQLPPEEQERWHKAQRECAEGLTAALVGPPTAASSSS